MDNLQEKLDKLKSDREKYTTETIPQVQGQINQQIAWFDGGISALEEILHPKEEAINENKT